MLLRRLLLLLLGNGTLMQLLDQRLSFPGTGIYSSSRPQSASHTWLLPFVWMENEMCIWGTEFYVIHVATGDHLISKNSVAFDATEVLPINIAHRIGSGTLFLPQFRTHWRSEVPAKFLLSLPREKSRKNFKVNATGRPPTSFTFPPKPITTLFYSAVGALL